MKKAINYKDVLNVAYGYKNLKDVTLSYVRTFFILYKRLAIVNLIGVGYVEDNVIAIIMYFLIQLVVQV